jgi:hypothetical protein
MQFQIFFHNLDYQTQQRILQAFGVSCPEELGWDSITPLMVLDIPVMVVEEPVVIVEEPVVVVDNPFCVVVDEPVVVVEDGYPGYVREVY